MPESCRIQQVQSPIIPVVSELIRDHPGTISLGQGVAYYGPPPQAIEAIAQFLANPENHKYQSVQGIPKLLEMLETKLRQENGINVQAGRACVVTAGGNMAFMNAILAITAPGDEVIIQVPYYFNHEMAIPIAGCKAVLVQTDQDYQLNLAAIEAAVTSRTRAVVTVSPNNPTGAVYSEAALREVNRLCRKNEIYHISDEAYENFVYDDASHFSPGSIDQGVGRTISLYSMSKAFGFASWRVGYMVIPEDLLGAVKKIQDTILICPPVISQYAAVAALQAGPSYCRKKLKAIVDVRALVWDELSKLGAMIVAPPAKGAFYVLLRVETNCDAMLIVERLIKEYGVAVIPGTTFGVTEQCCLRIAYGALQKETVAEGMGRFVRGMQAIVPSNP